jgi:hypothetical protein
MTERKTSNTANVCPSHWTRSSASSIHLPSLQPNFLSCILICHSHLILHLSNGSFLRHFTTRILYALWGSHCVEYGDYCLLGCDTVQSAWKVPTFRSSLVHSPFILNMEAVGSSRTIKTTWRHILEDRNLLYEFLSGLYKTSTFIVM